MSMPSMDLDRYCAAIFDCDGTLADTMPAHHAAWLTALRRNGAGFDFSWQLFVSRAGMPLEDTVRALNVQFGTQLDPTRVAEEQREQYAALTETIEAIDFVVAMARQIARTRPVAVASGGNRENVERTLQLLGIRELFSVVITASDSARGKPAPDCFLLAAQRLGVPCSACLVVEDSMLGIQAAKNAGMDSLLIDRDGSIQWIAYQEEARTVSR